MSSNGSAVARPAPKGVAMIRAMVAGAITIGSLALAAGAQAATVYTYKFTQGGYVPEFPQLDNESESVTGFFSGTPDGNGNFDLQHLAAFAYQITLHIGPDSVPGYSTTTLSTVSLFSYEPGNSSSLDLIQKDPNGIDSLCIGAAAAFGYCGGSGNLGESDGVPNSIFWGWYTSEAPQVTLFSVTSTAVTPIAPTLPLFVTSLVALGLAGWRKRRSRPAT